MIGRTVSHYRIVEKLGEGGMGIVYLAEDTSLKRKVALKFLPASLADDEVAHKRFSREAVSAAALEHPFICNIKEVASHEDRPFIVMEYVEGKTLQTRLAKGPLPLKEALRIATEVSEGLGVAHNRSIIHRDLKPSNIMITPEGHAKIMDFGLAKQIPTETWRQEAESALTTDGSTLGTLAYMSPEQLRGEEVDARSDIFSFGVVLYEMLSGEHPFRKASPMETASAVLNESAAPLIHYVDDLPEGLPQVVQKMLDRSRKRRYQSAQAVQTRLEELQETLAISAGEHPVWKLHRSWFWRAVALSLLVLAAAGLYWVAVRTALDEVSSPPLTAVPLTTYPGWQFWPSFSPDGRQVAFGWAQEDSDNTDIYVKFVDGEESRRLTTSPATDWGPVWSPDGKQIAFTRFGVEEKAQIGIFLVPLVGSERKLYSFGQEAQAALDWSPDGKWIAFAERSAEDPPQTKSLFLLSVETREERRLTQPAAPSLGDGFPAFSPDSQTVAFTRDRKDILLVPVKGGRPQALTSKDWGYINRLAWTRDGREIVFSVGLPMGGTSHLWRVSVSGGAPRRLAVGGDYANQPTISRQGDRLAYAQGYWSTSIWQITRTDGTGVAPSPIRLIGSTRIDAAPQFSPDGLRIAFLSERSGHPEIWIVDRDGSNPFRLTHLDNWAVWPSWSADGQQIAFTGNAEASSTSDILVVSAEGGPPRSLTSSSTDAMLPSWSHDNRWIYFSSPRDGKEQIFRIPVEGGEVVQVTQKGGFRAIESSDGKFLYYTHSFFSDNPKGVWRVPVEGGEETLVLDALHPKDWGAWALTEQGIYFYLEAESGPTIQYFDLVSGQHHTVAKLEKKIPYITMWTTLAVSPDEQRLLYLQLDEARSNLMLVENFR